VDQSSHADGANGHVNFTKHVADILEKLLDGLPFSFRSDDDTGIDG
jgi:hypothetical protein